MYKLRRPTIQQFGQYCELSECISYTYHFYTHLSETYKKQGTDSFTQIFITLSKSKQPPYCFQFNKISNDSYIDHSLKTEWLVHLITHKINHHLYYEQLPTLSLRSIGDFTLLNTYSSP